MAESIESPQAPSTTQEVRFSFHGDGGEFFRIWIVNLVLSILTLGIYSAWAKVRTKRYFYGNTELAGDRFDYLASPIAILKGRIIAVALLGIYTVLSVFFVPVSYLVLALLLLVMPYVVMRSIRFNAVMSSWRGVRFGFGGDIIGAYKAVLLWPLFGFLTLGLGMPYAWYKQNQYLYNNYAYGKVVLIYRCHISRLLSGVVCGCWHSGRWCSGVVSARRDLRAVPVVCNINRAWLSGLLCADLCRLSKHLFLRSFQ
jgi:uncharacterized membrane protein YjgN (DUF898 family)